MPKKMFTLHEANELLPIVSEELEQVQNVKKQFTKKYIILQKLRKQASEKGEDEEGDPFFTLECELEFLQMEAQTHMDSIRRKGVELKNIDSGLLDFPSIIDGQEVLLCWKQGEERIEFFHGLYDGFAGRKRLVNE